MTYLNFRIKFLLLIITVLLSSCATITVETTATSYGKTNLSKEIYFIPKADLEENSLVDQCKLGALRSGIKILNQPCENCLSANLIGKVTDKKTVNSGTVSTYVGYGVSTHQNRYQNITGRQAEIKIFKNNQQIHGIKLNSEGTSPEILPVIKYMCEAGFKDYPKLVPSKTFNINYDSE